MASEPTTAASGTAGSEPITQTGPCTGCGASAWKRLRTRDYNQRVDDREFRYRRCGACGMLELLNRPLDLGRYYPPSYYHRPASREAFRREAEFERYKLDLVRPLARGVRLVEIGAGGGAFAALALEAGFEVSTVEMDEPSCRFLEEVVGVTCVNTTDTVGALRTAERPNVIAMWHVLEHLSDPWDTFDAAAQALEPDGLLVVALPNPHSLQLRALRSRWAHIDAPRHLSLIPLEVLKRRAEALGLEVAVATTRDPGTLWLNFFGWRESLASFATGRRRQRLLRITGRLLELLARPLERTGLRGTAYTLILRRPT